MCQQGTPKRKARIMTSNLTVGYVVDRVIDMIDSAALAKDAELVAVATLGAAAEQGLAISAVHAELVKRGYSQLKLTRAYAMAFAGWLAKLPLAVEDGQPVRFATGQASVIVTMLRAYNVKGGSAKIKRELRKASATRQSAYEAIEKFSQPTPVDVPATDTPPVDVPAPVETTAADLLASIRAIMGGLKDKPMTDADKVLALALGQRLAVHGGIPAQSVSV